MYLGYQNVIFHLDLQSSKANQATYRYCCLNKIFSFFLKCSTMDPWLKPKFRKHSKLRIWKFQSVFSVKKCHLSPRFGIVIIELVNFEISLIVKKLSLSSLNSSTIPLWLNSSFQDSSTISKCLLSPRFGIVKTNQTILG